MNRLLEPTSGHVKLNGQDVTHVGGLKLRKVRKRVGMIFQQFNLIDRLTVLENVLAGRLVHCSNLGWHWLSLLKIFPKREKEIAFECLKKVRIEHLAYQRADTLSGGQQQRVAIARALAQEPYAFLADEPVASLDPVSAEIVMETLQEIQESQKIPVLINLHQISLARKYAKKLFGMADGSMVFEGKRTELTPEAIETIYGVEMNETISPFKDDEKEKSEDNYVIPIKAERQKLRMIEESELENFDKKAKRVSRLN
jgi:phosphonate transport system ATP-binding protein